MGRFDYPSPYWDTVGDPALDLIDKMLTVDVDKRISIDECLEHPWITQRALSLSDSTDGLTGAIAGLDFSRRKVQRERTMLCSINEVKVERVIETQPDAPPVKVWDKNSGPRFHTQRPAAAKGKKKQGEVGPDGERDPKEFIEMGGVGDATLFDDASGSRYPGDEMQVGPVKGEEEEEEGKVKRG
jgi:serine/threonine-protein kinase Chk2